CGHYRYDREILGDYLVDKSPTPPAFEFYELRSYGVDYWHEAGPVPADAPINGIQADIYRVLSETQHISPQSWASSSLDVNKEHLAARALLPADAELQQTLPRNGSEATLREVYHSKSLAGRYQPLPDASDPWKGKVP